MPSRKEALDLLERWVDNVALRNHMKSVEAAMRWYARQRGADDTLSGSTMRKRRQRALTRLRDLWRSVHGES